MEEGGDSICVQRIGEHLPIDEDAEEIELHLSRIRCIENLESCVNLKKLCLVSNVIEKIENLGNNLALEHLDLYQNKITVIENINHLTNLKILDLSFNHVSKIENIDALVKLEELYLSNNHIKKIENVSQFTQLKLLEVGSNKISNYGEVEYLKSLTALWMGKNRLTTMDLPSLPDLQKCSLQNNRIREWDANVLENCPNLEEFYLSYNHLTEIPQFITLMPKLTILDLGNNQISKIDIGEINSTIEELWLNDNAIEDEKEVNVLKKLGNLKVLYLERNPIQYKLGPSYRNRILDILPNLKQLDAVSLENRTY
ncbi:leucine rich repeat domain-containing protein [Theileria equi strain WA]|uniref:Leucine rich repeat domain-containing protein n=1 Tax=Theileria equi strain WA TaxID=1537102 RepID=L0AZZ8_THEEQ|nr:leucine rich repeat domain-containing protein [Theileria equi strain WA]AFZ81145.1 leucine rich repeat domain-containing protein [Theileria equi strain WA]|eukprot:XP_004830811.1 leucine rich repeat domain-containing protein [Theileria equi strain WA]